MEVTDYLVILDNISEIPFIDDAFYHAFLKPPPEKISIRSADGKQKLLARLDEE